MSARGSALSLAARYLRDHGNRAHDANLAVTVFGCTGFLGGYVCANLANMGCTVIAPYRGDEDEVRHLRVMSELGQFLPIPFSVRDRESVRKAIKGSDVVINLIGKHYPTKHLLPWWINYSLNDSNVTAAQTIAEICKEEQVPRLIHHSSLLASMESPSEWAVSKALGEKAVLDAFPDANIVRSSIMYGREDRFLNRYANALKMFKLIPLIEGGKAKLEPVYVNDVASAILSITLDNEINGKTFELVGNEEYTYKEIADVVMDLTKRTGYLMNIPLSIGKLFGKAMEQMPDPKGTQDLATLMTLDQKKTSDLPGLLQLDVEASSFEKEAFNVLYCFRRGGHFQNISGYH